MIYIILVLSFLDVSICFSFCFLIVLYKTGFSINLWPVGGMDSDTMGFCADELSVLFFDWDSLKARLNSYYKVWSY